MNAPVRALLVRIAVVTALVLLALLGLARAGLVLDPAVPVAGAVLFAAVLWTMRADVDRDDALSVPDLHEDPQAASPHGGDLQVRRHEELISAALGGSRERRAQLGRVLAEAFAARAADPEAPAPDPGILALVAAAADEEDPGSRRALSALGDRTTLHAVLRELARTGPAPGSAPSASAPPESAPSESQPPISATPSPAPSTQEDR